MDFNSYQKEAKKTAVFPDVLDGRFYYPAIGLAGEVGEVLNKIQKVARDRTEVNKEDLKSELGDVLWYLSQLAEELGISMEDVAAHNLEKLRDRAARGKIQGAGDNR